jgi:hypothetical protein
LAPYLHKVSAVLQIMHFLWCYLGQICIKFGANLVSKLKKFKAETTHSDGSILDEFTEQHLHQRTLFKPDYHFFNANKMQI